MKQHTVYHLYVPSPSPFWTALKEKYAGRLASMIRALVEEHGQEWLDEKISNDTMQVEIEVGGVRYAGALRKQPN